MDSLSPEEELPHLKNEIGIFRGGQTCWPISYLSTCYNVELRLVGEKKLINGSQIQGKEGKNKIN